MRRLCLLCENVCFGNYFGCHFHIHRFWTGLESESRTLARRISGISLSGEEVPPNHQTYQPEVTLSVKQNTASSTSPQQSETQKLYTPQYSDRKIPKPTILRVNGSESSSKLKFERTRTYSSPYASALPNGQVLLNGNTGHKKNASKSADPPRSSMSRRPSDVKPTRIPKAARGSSFSNGYSPSINGNGHNPGVVTPSQSPEIPTLPFSEQRGPQRGPQRAVVAALSTPSVAELPTRPSRQGTALLSESPPFTSISSMASFSPHDHEPLQNEAPPRPSIDSEERPYEHWYRGEVSRNGGVGELRVGRRQEMLDIANYGHMIAKKPTKPHVQPVTSVDEPRRHRKRADSIGGMTDKEREERGSLYLDDEHATNGGYVLDESPLTDLDGEGSDINSGSDYYDGPYAYIPEVEDNSTPLPQSTPEARSLTPTSILPSMIPRPSSRQHGQSPPPRIPAFSSRQSSESRRSTTPQTTPPMAMTRGVSEPPQLPSSSKTPSPPPAAPSSSNSRQQTYNSNTLPTSVQKGGASPASKKSRTTASKPTRTKTPTSRKEQDEQNRISVAYYPTPAGHGDGDMADAIPSWTQPIHRERNWDEVCFTCSMFRE